MPSRNPEMISEQARLAAVLELVFAGALWGFGFIAATWMLEASGPFLATGIRFLSASIVGLMIILLIPSLRKSASLAQFKLAAVPGLLLTVTLILQTWGLRYTTATKSGFITVLYVLIVPVLEKILLQRRLGRLHLVFVILALIGVSLICDLWGALWAALTGSTLESTVANSDPTQAAYRWNIGDLLTLLCAIMASFQILWFGFIQKKIGSSIVFNVYQTIWATALPLLLALILEPMPSWHAVFSGQPLVGLLMLAGGSTLIAFALQVKAQKEISPSLASLLFLLESPFAALFAVYFLNEHLRTEQWIGAGLILVALAMSTLFTAESATPTHAIDR